MFSFLKIDFGTTFFFKQMGQKWRVDLRLSGLRDTYRRFLLWGGGGFNWSCCRDSWNIISSDCIYALGWRVTDGRKTTYEPHEFLTFVTAGWLKLEIVEPERNCCVI